MPFRPHSRLFRSVGAGAPFLYFTEAYEARMRPAIRSIGLNEH